MDFFGVRGRGVPNSSRETFSETFRAFGVFGSVDGGGDLTVCSVSILLPFIATSKRCPTERELLVSTVASPQAQCRAPRAAGGLKHRRELEGVRKHLLFKKVFLCFKKVFRRKNGF